MNRKNLSDDNLKRSEKPLNHMEPFPFSALHFLRNRLLPSGENIQDTQGFNNVQW